MKRPRDHNTRGPLPGTGGRPKLPPGARKISGSLAMPAASWQRLDALRGTLSRGDYIAALLQSGR